MVGMISSTPGGLSGWQECALNELIAELRPRARQLLMRFEGLPGEFSQHDFGEVRINYLDGTQEVVRFFCSRLKWSRWAVVDLVPNQVAETLIRTLADHFVEFGGVPLCCVFDRPKTMALRWAKNGEVTEWDPIFAYAALELGFTAEVCWPRRANIPRHHGFLQHSSRRRRALEPITRLAGSRSEPALDFLGLARG